MKHMKLFASSRPLMLPLVLVFASALQLQSAQAQSICSNDKQTPTQQLLERFINADCETCWADPAALPATAGQIVLDWVVPGSKGDDGILSAVANRDGLTRLAAVAMRFPESATTRLSTSEPHSGIKLRVAHGLALSGYVGASIELKPSQTFAHGLSVTAWLALVEMLPKGTEGSVVERNLVRNVFTSAWNMPASLRKKKLLRLYEARAMSVAQGIDPDRLRVVGWIEDQKGRLVTAAQSECTP